ASGSTATSAASTRRCSPEAMSVTTIAARRAARSALRAERIERCISTNALWLNSHKQFAIAHKAKQPMGSALHIRLLRALLPAMTGKLLHLFDQHADRTAAGQTDLPGRVVGNTEFQQARLAALDHVHRLGYHGALDAAARHRAEEVALFVDHQVGADRARRRAPRLDNGCERD